MSLPRRSGFTLVELLMVVLILGMLLALIFPAINRVRESTRETVCRDQMRNVAMAVDVFSEKNNHYPGWRHDFPTKNAGGQTVKMPMPWIVPILDNLDRSDIGDHIKGTIANNIQWPWVEILVCPSDRDKIGGTGPMLSYVGNAGRPDTGDSPPDYRSNGIFLDLSDKSSKQQTPSFVIKADGKANTLLLSENLNANHWGKIGNTEINEFDHCIVFHTSATADRMINSQPSSGATPMDLARPSSNHLNGVNVVMASGAARLLSQDTDYNVYRAMLNVDDQNDP